MTNPLEQAGVSPVALVVVPFASRADAEAWAETIPPRRTDAPVIVTEGTEQTWHDPHSGAAGYELCFEGGWRAKYAGSGTVVLAQNDRRCADDRRKTTDASYA